MKTLFNFIASILVIVAWGLIVSFPVMLLWNYCLVGAVAGISQIGWLQAWGIMILIGLLINKD